MRVPIVAGNWKMNLGRVDDALAFVRRIRYPLNQIKGIESVLCPPFTVLSSLAEALRPTHIALAAQTMHWEDRGAFTGEISPAMLAGLCRYVILGHSERRSGRVVSLDPSSTEVFEGDQVINRKVHAALQHGLRPIICVGEDLAKHEAGQTEEYVGAQVGAALAGLSAAEVQRCVIAYEPVWAIGTGRAAAPAYVNRVIGITIRGVIADMFGEEAAQAVRCQYGGSVAVDNIVLYMSMPEIDGALVGGASLTVGFVELVRRAATGG